MRKFLTFLMLLVLMAPYAVKADEVIVGTGTSVTREVPFATYYSNSWCETIYPAEEVGQAGMINSLSYFCTTPNQSMYFTEMRIYLGVADKEQFSWNADWLPESELTMVYQKQGVTIGGVDGWQTFELDTPFLYEGVGNLVVVVAKNSYSYNGNMRWQYSNDPGSCLYVQSDYSGSSYLVHQGSRTGGISEMRANVKFDITPMDITCYSVKSVAGVSSTERAITISWEPSEGQTAWDVYITKDGDAPDANTAPTATAVTETEYTFDWLNSNTTYKFFVRGNCGESVSIWKGASYKTLPDFGGAGTEEDPYRIYSKQDLQNLADVMKSGFNTEGKYFLQMNDIETITFSIGDNATIPFKGTYDGNGYSVDIDLYGDYNRAFFTTVGAGAVIKNLTITGESESWNWQTAGVVAYIDLTSDNSYNNVVIENCVNRASVKSNGNNAGGIISDFNSNGNHILYIKNCVNYGTITGVGGSSYAGGIAGRLQINSHVDNCVNYGSINGVNYLGGIVAYPRTNVVISNSANKGAVTGTSDRIGGISGYTSSGSIINCYNIGEITGATAMGGIIGRVKSGGENLGVVYNVYNAGKVNSSSNDTSTTGAIFGFNEGTTAVVSNAYYLEGVYGNAYGSNSIADIISNVSSFTRNENLQTNYILANEIAGTTDLITALNSFEMEGRSEWFADIHGNNDYYPTFVVGNSPGIEFEPSPMAMGARPIGANVPGKTITMKNTGSKQVEVTLLDLESSAFFTLEENIELPLVLEPGTDVELYVNTKPESAIEAGEVSTGIAAMWNNMNRLASIGEITATAYVPAEGDVVETAQTVNAFPFMGEVSSANVYNNYNLPGNKAEANDVVYEINVTEDVLLNANVIGANNKIAVYAEDLGGAQYPDQDNNYTGVAINEVAALDYFYFNQAEMVTHPGQGWAGDDVSAIIVSSYGLNVNKDWYWAADDFSSNEDFTINEMEFFAYQTGSSTVSTMTGLYLQIYDGNPMEGGNVVWGDMTENVMSYTEWTGIYRTDPLDLLNTERPIMRLVASDLNIELEAGTYWVAVGMSGTLSSGPYVIPRSINGLYDAGNALAYANNSWSPWTSDGYGQGLTMILKENGNNRTDIVRNEQNSYSGKPSELFEACATRNTRGDAAIYGGDNAIENVVLTPGKYYVVASSSSADFAVEIDTEVIPVPEAPVVVYPQNAATDISDPLTLRWTLGQYTTEYQLLFGGTYPPTQVLQDWTTELANGYIITDLNNNQNYFWQIKERNASGVTEGPIWAFTTSFNVPQGLKVADANLYPGEDAVLTWNPMDRTHRGYNIYQDDVKINKSLVTGTSFTVSDLAYNKDGYEFRVTAVYDEGESEKSLAAKAYMTGNGTVEGYTYEQDGVTPIPNVTVKFSGFDEYSNPTTATFVSDENGYYTGELLAGKYSAKTTVENYQDALLLDINVTYDMMTSGVNFAIFENYLAVADVKAEEIDNSNVNVYWSWSKMASDVVDFETGDFSQAEFNNAISEYPWVIVEGGCESNYAMKSTCEGVDYGISAIEVTVDVPMNGVVGFNYRVSSEAGWDLGNFYIDGELKMSVSGQTNWAYKQVDVTEGTHTYKWEFAKDVMDLDPVGEDAFFIDNISFYGEKEPFAGGWIHYDDGAYASSIGTGQFLPCYWAVSFPAAEYAGYSIDKVSVFDSPDAGGTGTATVNVYLGGETAPGTLMATKDFQMTNSGEFVEIALDAPVAIDGTQKIWIVAYAELPYPAAGCVYVSDPNSDWISLDGTTWLHAVTDYYLNYSWMLRANLTNAKGQTMALTTASKAPKFEGGVSTGTFVAAENVTPINVGVPASSAMARNENSNRALQSYKVYRVDQISGVYTEETVEVVADEITDTTFIDTNWGTLEAGVYKWGVAAVYEGNRTSVVNNAKSFVPGPDFVAESQKALEYDGEINVKDFDPTMLRGKTAYANVVYPMNMPAGYVAFDLGNPATAVTIGNVIADRSGEYYDGVFYGYNSTNTFFKINPVTGEILSQSTVSAAPTEMAYDYSTETMYGVSDDMLYTIDLENGNITVVGSIGQTFMAFGIDLSGNAYGVELGSGDFYSIDLANLTTSRIAATGLGCNYLQTGGFDHETETFYWFQCYDANNMGLYSIDITTGAATLVASGVGEVTSWFVPYVYDPNIAVVYPFQDSNESAIVWSQPIDKDMFTTVDVALATNNGDSPAGATVEFINLTEPGMGYDYVVTIDETGACSWNNFRKGDYMLTISLPGFVSCAIEEIMEIWDATVINCTLEEIAAAVSSLYVSPTGWAMWEQSTGDDGDEVEFGFEEGLEGWTTIDADGDGLNWVHTSGLYDEYGAVEGPSHSGSGHILSGSFSFNLGELSPDNYIVSPEKLMIGGNSVFTFWASAQDSEYPTEHFGVAVSTTGNSSADDFTTIWEETMVAKGAARVVADGTRGYGTWYEYKVDLREYAGQSIYVAFRHFDSFDQFLLRIDDVKLANRTSATASLTSYTVMLNGYVEAEVTTPYHQHENLIGGEQYTTTVVANFTTGESEAMSYTWDYMDCSNFAGATEFTAEYANGNAVLNWTLPGGNSDDDGGETAASFGFENDLEGWTLIDADGDGHKWYHSSESETYHVVLPGDAHTGTGYVCSESFCNGLGALYPDNYIVSPQKYAITAGSKISFWACTKDDEWASEIFGVAVSTAGNTSASDFTTIVQWTMTGKSSKATERGRGNQGTWYQYEADLSEYAGQEVYVALRHFNTTDMFIIMVDDVEITSGSKDSKEGIWKYYDNGTLYDGIGGPATFSWGIKLRSADIAGLGSLTKVSIYDRVATSGTFDICLGGDNAPGASVLNQAYSLSASNDFVEFTLTEAVNPAGQNVWIVFNTDDGANYPASSCSNTGDADGRWIYLASDGWFDVLTGAGLDVTWMIRGYFEEGGDNPNDDVNANLLGVMVYRDGELLTPQPLTTNSFTEPLAETGEYEYCIRVVHGGALDTTYYAMSCPQCETVVAEMACDAPENLYAEQAVQNGKSGVSLVWPFSEPIGEWLYYDNGTNEDAIGGPAEFQWGIMFPAESLAAYEGTSFTKVSLFDYAASSGDIKIYYGGTTAPQDLIHSQPYTVSGTGAFVEFDLTAALPVDPTMNVWVTFTTSQGTSYPAAVSANSGDANGRWISLDGSVWEDLLDYSLSNTWMMRAYVTNAKGEVSSLKPIADEGFTATGGELAVAGAPRATRELDHYNVYRSTTTNNFEVIAETTEGAYFDELTDSGTYYYQVTAVYVENGEECESDPANSYLDPTQDYVSVEFVSIDEYGVNGMMIYPNPTKGDLNITVESMTRITITNALGQVMFDQEVDTDNKIINMAQYEAGVYMVRITTENGIAVERITVIR